jgi:uncharacterized protein (DUF2147 family)
MFIFREEPAMDRARSLNRRCWARVLVLLAATCWIAPGALAADPKGVWLVQNKAAIEIADCDGLLCGRIVWLKEPRDGEGNPKHDKLNPDPALRPRPLCGLTVLERLRPAGNARWKDGLFYNPDDGKRYDSNMTIKSPNVIAARIYLGMPIFGQNEILTRARRLPSTGWCPGYSDRVRPTWAG